MADSVYQLNILSRTGGQFTENVLHFQLQSSTGSEDPVSTAQNLVNAWRTTIESAWQDVIPTSEIIAGYKAKRINNGGGPTFAEPVTGIAGTRTGIVAEQSGGPCLISPYARGSRYDIGRIFIPGITQLDAVNGTLQAGIVTNLNALIGLLQGTFSSGGSTWQYVVWSRKFKIGTIPIDISLSLKVGIQKRRLTPVM